MDHQQRRHVCKEDMEMRRIIFVLALGMVIATPLTADARPWPSISLEWPSRGVPAAPPPLEGHSKLMDGQVPGCSAGAMLNKSLVIGGGVISPLPPMSFSRVHRPLRPSMLNHKSPAERGVFDLGDHATPRSVNWTTCQVSRREIVIDMFECVQIQSRWKVKKFSQRHG
ncbi:MAG: hypothetical protein FD149_2699 [Rhodospirillaceae bacterium]|nr:MAG: hypothetical protein FD149_2699 [Rhodospirillaceae bacterium]